MKTIGVGVEGPSDQLFWRKLLHRSFPEYRFDVHNMSNRSKLIRESGRLLDSFRSADYPAGILILDIDRDPCVEYLVSSFDDRVRSELLLSLPQRFFFLCVARRNIESWYLADPNAIAEVLPGTKYELPNDNARLGKGPIKKLCKDAGLGYNEIWFAEQIAPKFSVDQAKNHSTSFRIAWERIETAVGRAVG